jgi:DNA-binding NarL/FixJ family response regulator
MLLQILVAYKDQATRRHIRHILDAVDGWEVCAEVGYAHEVVDRVKKHKPDVAILDFKPKDGDALEVARQIRAVRIETEIVVLCRDPQPENYLNESIRAGALGCLLEKDLSTELVPAVTAVHCGKLYLPTTMRSVVRPWLTADAPAEEREKTAHLSDREIQVVRLVTQGASTRDVAMELCISVKTVEAHRARIMRKLGIHSVVELVHYAIRKKIIDA